MAEAENKAPTKWETHLQIAMGPPDNHVFKVGETATFKIAVLPQNQCPTAITQIFFYVGPPGKPKQVFKVFNGCPGRNPQVSMHDFKYKIPAWEGESKNHGMLLEFGWGQEMQYTWANAMANFARKGYKDNWLYTMSVAPPESHKQSFLFDLCTPLPTRAVAGETIVLDFSYRTQNHYPNAISQALVYYRDEKGDCDRTPLEHHVPGTNPRMKRGGLTYTIPKFVAGQELEVGAYFDLQYTFKDAVANFKKNGPSLVLGKIQIISPDSKDADEVREANLHRHAANFHHRGLKLPHPKLEAEIRALFAVDENGESKATSWFEDNWDGFDLNVLKDKALQQVGIFPTKLAYNCGTRFGVRHLVASRATRIAAILDITRVVPRATTEAERNLVELYGYDALRRLAAEAGVVLGEDVVVGGFGQFLLKMTSPSMMVCLPGEFAGAFLGGLAGKAAFGKKSGAAVVTKEIGGLAGAMGAGAAAGTWLFPGVGTAAGAAAGFVSYGIGATIRAGGHYFHWW